MPPDVIHATGVDWGGQRVVPKASSGQRRPRMRWCTSSQVAWLPKAGLPEVLPLV